MIEELNVVRSKQIFQFDLHLFYHMNAPQPHQIAFYSNYGSRTIDVSAPGGDNDPLYATTNDLQQRDFHYRTFVTALIQKTALDYGKTGQDELFGSGEANLFTALTSK